MTSRQLIANRFEINNPEKDLGANFHICRRPVLHMAFVRL